MGIPSFIGIVTAGRAAWQGKLRAHCAGCFIYSADRPDKLQRPDVGAFSPARMRQAEPIAR
jgi:hypothetical protein